MRKQRKIYSDAIDGKALAQFISALGQPWAVEGTLMPDAHAGYSLPLGAVVATDRVGFGLHGHLRGVVSENGK